MFADDTTIFYSDKDINIKINVVNKDFQEVNWLKANKLSVNANKTNFMISSAPHTTLTKTRADLNVMQDSMVLERAKFTNFLGDV